MLDPREKARRDREKEQESELQSDFDNAVDLMGAAALGGMYAYPSFDIGPDA